MRTQFERLSKRVGLQPWPRLFYNLRSSRETELPAEDPIQLVTASLGNTPSHGLEALTASDRLGFSSCRRRPRPRHPLNRRNNGEGRYRKRSINFENDARSGAAIRNSSSQGLAPRKHNPFQWMGLCFTLRLDAICCENHKAERTGLFSLPPARAG